MYGRVSTLERYVNELEQEFLRNYLSAHDTKVSDSQETNESLSDGSVKYKQEIIPKNLLRPKSTARAVPSASAASVGTSAVVGIAAAGPEPRRLDAISKAAALMEDLCQLREIQSQASRSQQESDPAGRSLSQLDEVCDEYLARIAEKDAEIAALKASFVVEMDAMKAAIIATHLADKDAALADLKASYVRQLAQETARGQALADQLWKELRALEAVSRGSSADGLRAISAMQEQVDAVLCDLMARKASHEADLAQLEVARWDDLSRERARVDALLRRLECGLQDLRAGAHRRSAETAAVLDRTAAELDGARQELAKQSAAGASRVSALAESHWAHVLGLLAARSDLNEVRVRADARLEELERAAAAHCKAADLAVDEARRAAAQEMVAQQLIFDERIRAIAAARDQEIDALRKEVARLTADGLWLVELARMRADEAEALRGCVSEARQRGRLWEQALARQCDAVARAREEEEERRVRALGRMVELDAAVRRMAKTLDETSAALRNKEAELDLLRGEVEQARVEARQRAAAASAWAFAASAREEHLERAVAAAGDILEAVAYEVARLGREFDTGLRQLNAAREEEKALRRRLAALERAAAEREAAVAQLRREVAALRDEGRLREDEAKAAKEEEMRRRDGVSKLLQGALEGCDAAEAHCERAEAERREALGQLGEASEAAERVAASLPDLMAMLLEVEQGCRDGEAAVAAAELRAKQEAERVAVLKQQAILAAAALAEARGLADLYGSRWADSDIALCAARAEVSRLGQRLLYLEAEVAAFARGHDAVVADSRASRAAALDAARRLEPLLRRLDRCCVDNDPASGGEPSPFVSYVAEELETAMAPLRRCLTTSSVAFSERQRSPAVVCRAFTRIVTASSPPADPFGANYYLMENENNCGEQAVPSPYDETDTELAPPIKKQLNDDWSDGGAESSAWPSLTSTADLLGNSGGEQGGENPHDGGGSETKADGVVAAEDSSTWGGAGKGLRQLWKLLG